MDKQQTPSPRTVDRSAQEAAPPSVQPQYTDSTDHADQSDQPITEAEREEKRARQRRLRRHGRHFLARRTSRDRRHDSHPVSRSGHHKHSGKQSSRAAKVCRRIVAPILAIAALVCGVLAGLSSGPWKPNPIARATAQISTRYGATDPGVLPLVNSQVRITATASSPFCLAQASAQDADGWLEGTRYTRISGLKDWTHLQTRSTVLPSSSDTKNLDAQDAPASPKDSDPLHPAQRNTSVEFQDSDLWRTVQCGRSITLTWSGERNSHDVIVIDTQSTSRHANPVALSLSWKRTDTNNTPRILGLCALLLLLAAILFATVFSLTPRRRRKAQRLIDAERDPASTEGTDVTKVAGEDAPRWANDHILSRRKREGRRRHAGRGHRSGSAGRAKKENNSAHRLASLLSRSHSSSDQQEATQQSAHPAVTDIGGTNMVARLQQQQQSESHSSEMSVNDQNNQQTDADRTDSTPQNSQVQKPIAHPTHHAPTDADVREYLRRLSQEELGTSGLERDQGLDADTHFFAPIDPDKIGQSDQHENHDDHDDTTSTKEDGNDDKE
jgi:hypothetical protein